MTYLEVRLDVEVYNFHFLALTIVQASPFTNLTG